MKHTGTCSGMHVSVVMRVSEVTSSAHQKLMVGIAISLRAPSTNQHHRRQKQVEWWVGIKSTRIPRCSKSNTRLSVEVYYSTHKKNKNSISCAHFRLLNSSLLWIQWQYLVLGKHAKQLLTTPWNWTEFMGAVGLHVLSRPVDAKQRPGQSLTQTDGTVQRRR